MNNDMNIFVKALFFCHFPVDMNRERERERKTNTHAHIRTEREIERGSNPFNFRVDGTIRECI